MKIVVVVVGTKRYYLAAQPAPPPLPSPSR
jgi:hypothetical protein